MLIVVKLFNIFWTCRIGQFKHLKINEVKKNCKIFVSRENFCYICAIGKGSVGQCINNKNRFQMITCNCPPPASLPDLECVRCPERFGQIQKVAFQRIMNDDGTKNKFSATSGFAEINSLANWQAKMTAADSTKIVISPYIYSPTQESGAARTFGGGNDSLGGVEEIIGREPSTFSASLRNIPQSIAKVLKSLQCENVGVYLIDGNGNVEALGIVDENNNEWIMPIPIKAFFVGDKTHGGIDAPDANVIQWSFVPNYSDTLKIFTITSFNVLSDLCGGGGSDKAYMNDVNYFRTIIPSTATQITFLKGAGGILSGYTKIGYLDNNQEISVWSDTNYTGRYIVTSDKVIGAPHNCMYMFRNYSSCTSINFKNFDITEVEYIDEMFFGCNNLATIYSDDWDISHLFSSNMFYGCTSLVGGSGTTYNSSHTDGEYARIDRTGTPGYFTAPA